MNVVWINPFDGMVHQSPTDGSGPSPTPVIRPWNWNEYAEEDLALGVQAPIFMYTVPAGKTLSIFELVGWGDVDGEYILKLDGVDKGGGRTSPSDRTLCVSWAAPIVATEGQLVAVYGEQWVKPTKKLKINLMGDLT